MIIGMNKRDDALKSQIEKGIIAHGASRFGGESAVPIVWMQAVANLDFLNAIHFLMQETAISKNRVRCALDKREWERQSVALPAENFLEKRGRLFLGETIAAGEAHEIGVGKELAETVEIVFAKRPENQSFGFKLLRNAHQLRMFMRT